MLRNLGVADIGSVGKYSILVDACTPLCRVPDGYVPPSKPTLVTKHYIYLTVRNEVGHFSEMPIMAKLAAKGVDIEVHGEEVVSNWQLANIIIRFPITYKGNYDLLVTDKRKEHWICIGTFFIDGKDDFGLKPVVGPCNGCTVSGQKTKLRFDIFNYSNLGVKGVVLPANFSVSPVPIPEKPSWVFDEPWYNSMEYNSCGYGFSKIDKSMFWVDVFAEEKVRGGIYEIVFLIGEESVVSNFYNYDSKRA